MSSCTLPTNIKINNSQCKEFFSELVARFPEANEHYYLLAFLIKISERYKTDGRGTSFVLDLMQLEVPDLFSGIQIYVTLVMHM